MWERFIWRCIKSSGDGKMQNRLSKKNGKSGAIEDVYYVPDIKVNILSVGQLLQKGYEILTKGQQMQLRDKTGRVVLSSEMESNRMFKVNMEYSQELWSFKVDGKKSHDTRTT